MACAEMLFPGVDDALYARLVQQAIRAGATKDDNDRWKWNTKLGELEFTMRRSGTNLYITPFKKPLLVSCGMIQSHLSEEIENAKEAA